MEDDPFASLTDYDELPVNSPPEDQEQTEASASPVRSQTPEHEDPRESEEIIELNETDEIDEIDESDEPNVSLEFEPSERENSPFVPLSVRENAPLANIIGQEFQHIDPRTYFSDFKTTGILRFSKLFGVNPKALNQNKIWWPSKSFCNKPEQQRPKEAREFNLNLGPLVTRGECDYDQTELLLKSEAELEALKTQQGEEEDEVPPWRYGPAQMWYDRMGLPDKPKRFDYGFKTNKFNIISSTTKEAISKHSLTNEELLPVNLLHWEDNIIMDGSEIDINKITNGREPKCGWIATQQCRTYQAYKSEYSQDEQASGPDQTHSMFPVDNYDLENIRWEDDIILDPENMPAIPKPRVLTLEYEDDPNIFGMPEDILFEERSKEDGSKGLDRKDHQFTKKSKMILSQVQRRQKQEQEEHMESRTAQNADKDVFNMSNDEYYAPKNTHRAIGSGSAIQHSIPAQNIHRAFFPTHLDVYSLRHLHRLPASKRVMKYLIDRDIHIHNSLNFIAEAEEQRKRQTMMDSGSEIFHMRTARDLSARDGTLVCIEYSEEHPPLLGQSGMASKIRNYYRRKAQKENDVQFEFGETAFTMTPPFLGNLNIGQTIQAIENNMYRAPLFKHKMPTTDFILIRCADGLFLRECPNVFVAGQECPLYEVPSPNSKKAAAFSRDFLLAYIYRLFWESEHQPRRLRMDDIRDAFPEYAETSIRKRLKQSSDFIRSAAGPDPSYWVIKDDFRLPSKEEVLGMLTPEMCCAHYSMQAAERRLKDAGYGEKHFLTPENDEDSDDEVTIEDEIKCAPWNTTRAYISATKGKCLLDQSGVADPTGCGQGFSYVRVTQKPQKEDVPQMPKRLVTGTNADLRKLPLKEAKEICRGYGIKEEEINSLTRWEIIDVIRTLSTQAAKGHGDFSGMGRFARGNIKVTSADTQEKYKQYCQHVFDLQNKVLASSEQLSTDEGTDNEDSDNEDMASRLEKMLDTNKLAKGKLTSSVSKKAVEMEDEEKDRLALQRMIHGDTEAEKLDKKTGKGSIASKQQNAPSDGGVVRKLKIHRVFTASDGTESTRVEIINNQQVIDSYDLIRKTKDSDFIRVYATMDEQYKEEMRKQKRRLQDQLRRIKRKEQKDKTGATIGRPKKNPSDKPPPPIKPSLQKMKCSACGQTGHMKTNKNCPKYGERLEKRKEKTVGDICKNSMATASLDGMSLASGELISMEGTRFKVSHKLFEHSKKKKDLKLRIPTEFINQQKNPSTSTEEKSARLANQLRIEIESDMDDSQFSSSGFRPDLYSPASTIGSAARTPLTARSSFHGRRRGTLDEADYLIGPSKTVQRRRADPRVSLASILEEILLELKNISGAEHLLHPVNQKQVADYYDIVKTPMDLLQIRSRISANKYELRSQFMADLVLILRNTRMYNGPQHPITIAAEQIVERAVTPKAVLLNWKKAINPLLDENDLVGFSYILNDIVQQCKNLPKSVAFHARVDPKKYPTYYNQIENPMDLGTIEQKIKDKQYKTTASFLADMEQIHKNSLAYNGEMHAYTEKAKEILDFAMKLVGEKRNELDELESRIEAPAAADTQSVDYNTMDEELDDMTRDTAFGNLEEQDVHRDVEELSENMILPTDDEATMDAWESGLASGLAGSQMEMSGQLNADLELTDSDDSENEGGPEKRPRLDDDLEEL
ncbi:Transcription initiation factor TFIID subunit 1 [Aphelenchoides bicaudatus]|nr:Transcription initiation factor TFIID subunit 1 [Aphelenchoides bicaudatus]